jgi:hypothetical protein
MERILQTNLWYITYKIRDSKIKKGYQEGYEAKLLIFENDSDFLYNEFISIKDNILRDQNKILENLSYLLIDQLKKLNFAPEKLAFFKSYFNDEIIESNVFVKTIKFRIYKHGLEAFFPDEFEHLIKKLEDAENVRILKEVGIEGGNVYEILTSTFFNNFALFEIILKKFHKKILNREFIFKVIYESDSLPWDNSFNSLKKFIKLIDENQIGIDKENTLKIFSNLSTPKIRLYLWLNGLSDHFDFDEYKENVWVLERKDQASFIKKIFYFKSKGTLNFELKDLNQIKVFDINTYRQIKEGEPTLKYKNLDFNVSLLILILNSFADSSDLKANIWNKIFEHLLTYMAYPKDIQYVDFFYSKCIGRTKGLMKEIKNPETKLTEIVYSFPHDKEDKPLYHNYCDGQKASKELLGFPATNLHSWCGGIPCFGSAIQVKDLPENYNDLTLKDFLSILKIDYSPNTLAILSGYINKANLLIHRLRCNSCKSILAPSNTSNFSWHIINNFHCIEKSCSEYYKEVYLNHCLNKNCYNVIDSRISKKCKHEGLKDFFGWYICSTCYSCCSSDTINKIKEKKKLHNLPYNGSHVGHDELKIIFCYHCGSKMVLNMDFYQRQKEIIKGLINPKSNHFVQHTEKKDRFWKFTLNLSSFNEEKQKYVLDELNHYGFKVEKGKMANIFFATLLICIALKCENDECNNTELFSPLSKTWKIFKDSHMYLYNEIKRSVLMEEIKDEN